MANRSYPGPFSPAVVTTADALVWPPANVSVDAGPGILGGLQLDNGSGAPVTFTIYDSRTATGQVITKVRVPATTTVIVPIACDFEHGLFVSCSLWTSCTASVQYKPK